MYCVGYLDDVFTFEEFNTAFKFGMNRKIRDKNICMFIGKVVIDNGFRVISKEIGTDYFYFNEQ